MRPTVAPAKLVSIASATSSGAQAVAGDRRPVEHEAHERDVHLLLEREIDDARHAGSSASRTRSPSRRSVGRSSPKTLTAMFARVPDSMWSMRCEIGWPIVTFVPGSVEKPRRSAASSSARGRSGVAQADVDLRRLDALHVLVELGAAGPPRRGDDLGLRQQDLLDAPADLVGLGERRAGQRVGLHGQAALVELRQERRAHPRQRRRPRPTSEHGRQPP